MSSDLFHKQSRATMNKTLNIRHTHLAKIYVIS